MNSVYVQIIGTDSFFELPWPDGVRIPVAGEQLLIAAESYVVHWVQWETDQGEGFEFSVQLRVVRG